MYKQTLDTILEDLDIANKVIMDFAQDPMYQSFVIFAKQRRAELKAMLSRV